jgi:hypothetical protein
MGHRMYPELFPRYEFTSSQHLDKFLTMVRERDMLAKFMPDIYVNGKKQAIGRAKWVRLWKKEASPPVFTLTFLDKTTKELKEMDLAEYENVRRRKKSYFSGDYEVRIKKKNSPSRSLAFVFEKERGPKGTNVAADEFITQLRHMNTVQLPTFGAPMDLGNAKTFAISLVTLLEEILRTPPESESPPDPVEERTV